MRDSVTAAWDVLLGMEKFGSTSKQVMPFLSVSCSLHVVAIPSVRTPERRAPIQPRKGKARAACTQYFQLDDDEVLPQEEEVNEGHERLESRAESGRLKSNELLQFSRQPKNLIPCSSLKETRKPTSWPREELPCKETSLPRSSLHFCLSLRKIGRSRVPCEKKPQATCVGSKYGVWQQEQQTQDARDVLPGKTNRRRAFFC